MIEGAKNMLPVAVLLAAAGLIVGTFTLTGLGLKISSIIMSVERRLGAGRPAPFADRLHAHRPEPAHHRHLHHDRGHGRPGPGQDRRARACGAPARLLLRRAFRGFPAGRPVPLRGRGGHGREPVRLDDAGLEIFPAGLPGAVLLLDDHRRPQPPDRGGELARFPPGPRRPASFPCFSSPWGSSDTCARRFPCSSGCCCSSWPSPW